PLFPPSLACLPAAPTLSPYTTLFRSDSEFAGVDLDRPGAVVPDLEDDFAGVVEPEDRVAPQKLTPTAELHEHLGVDRFAVERLLDRKSTRLNSSHRTISYAGLCLKKT